MISSVSKIERNAENLLFSKDLCIRFLGRNGIEINKEVVHWVTIYKIRDESLKI